HNSLAIVGGLPGRPRRSRYSITLSMMARTVGAPSDRASWRCVRSIPSVKIRRDRSHFRVLPIAGHLIYGLLPSWPNYRSHSCLNREKKMQNHFPGLSLGPPLGDQRLDLCDLYAFQSPTDQSRTVIILNANPNADALHPDAIYRLNIDNDGDLLTDLALSYVFSKAQNGN